MLCAWDYAAAAPFALPEAEVAHFQRWRSHLGAGEKVVVREPVAGVDEVLVPWRAVVVLPELVVEPIRTDGYRALVKAGVAAQLSMIGYDLIPVTISETVTPGMSSNFANYLSVVKHIDRISCISLSSASEFQGFASMLAAQGLAGPHVVGQPLPSEAPDVPEAWLAEAEELLAVDSLPLVLVVGSHEPRKNHLTVLVAAERLWREGLAFHLTFIGGSGWSSEAFDDLVVELAERGRPVQVLKRADEAHAVGGLPAGAVHGVPLAHRRFRPARRRVAHLGHARHHLRTSGVSSRSPRAVAASPSTRVTPKRLPLRCAICSRTTRCWLGCGARPPTARGRRGTTTPRRRGTTSRAQGRRADPGSARQRCAGVEPWPSRA